MIHWKSPGPESPTLFFCIQEKMHFCLSFFRSEPNCMLSLFTRIFLFLLFISSTLWSTTLPPQHPHSFDAPVRSPVLLISGPDERALKLCQNWLIYSTFCFLFSLLISFWCGKFLSHHCFYPLTIQVASIGLVGWVCMSDFSSSIN